MCVLSASVAGMRILILGGTSFIGRALVSDALGRGHDVTLFNRGRTGADLFPEVPRLLGDRDTGEYASLGDGEWDAAVDLSGYYPAHVEAAMDALGERVGRYVFVSSHAVYDPLAGPGGTEEAPRKKPLREADQLDDTTYGRLKTACEDAVTARFGERATIVRPIRVTGPYEPNEAMTYWIRRAAPGGTVAVPGSPAQPFQAVDVRDLARLVVRLAEDGRGGAFHAVGPAEPTTLGGLIEACARMAGTTVELRAAPLEAFPRFFAFSRVPELWNTLRRDGSKAWAAGMPRTPLADTIARVAAWDRERGEPDVPAHLSPEAEAAILAG